MFLDEIGRDVFALFFSFVRFVEIMRKCNNNKNEKEILKNKSNKSYSTVRSVSV